MELHVEQPPAQGETSSDNFKVVALRAGGEVVIYRRFQTNAPVDNAQIVLKRRTAPNR